MDNNFILNPADVANGSIMRSEITEQFTESAKQNGLLPLDKLRFFRETSKAATDAEKVKEDKKSPSLMELAIKQAKSLREFKLAMKNGSKEFPYNGCTYQYREEVTVDLSDCEGEYAEAWKEQVEKLKELETEMETLRNKQKAAKSAKESAEKNYQNENPDCPNMKKTVKPTLVVL